MSLSAYEEQPRPLTDQERRLVRRLFSDFAEVPPEWKAELRADLERDPPVLGVLTLGGQIPDLSNSNQVIGQSGWIEAAGETWTWQSDDVSQSIAVFTVKGDRRVQYFAGVRVRFTQSGTVKYAVIVNSSYAGGITTVTIFGGGMVNATITKPAYSSARVPNGFFAGAWQRIAIDTSFASQANPTANVWYYTGVSFTLPPGSWLVAMNGLLDVNHPTDPAAKITLATAQNAETDPSNTVYMQVSSVPRFVLPFSKVLRPVTVPTTTYYLNYLTTAAGTTSINLRGDVQETQLIATLAYI